MVLNGKAYISLITVAGLLGVTDNALYQLPYTNILAKMDRVTIGSSTYVAQKDMYDYLDELAVKDIFHKEVQACLLLILDKTTDNKGTVARKLGWKHIGTLENFLEKVSYGKSTAETFVRMCRHYLPIVRLYDKEYF